ncbi:DNA polymerase III subunit gamma/tau [Leptolyngbya sp. FACHB-321]|uniref:DNA polymerase III subunit gamma/tau n=1 Tax=Leptolyngbya sp. FACHB-321 TaxID=2692807 RepID=UPI0016829BF0|nr:DNA polymerase III subunit gamma/tau [Leptolyngbya sp. FACHB-321]MBD2038617.1 DNA polymerase III subunit gamma/tau [Leptolyngbya sp. FACHB-321]
MTYQPLHHKYRPQTFSDLVGQEAIATTLTNALHQQRIAPAYLFTGARGTGKTSSARILAKSLNCLAYEVPTEQPCGVCEVCQSIAKGSALDVIEIDAASNTGVDNMRELIERSQFAPVQCRYKVYVVDECHMLSTAAFNALLKTLEEPPNRVVFVLATTDPQRVLPTIISRCQRFDFRRIPLMAIVQHLTTIAAKEAISITQEAITLVAQISQGGLRDAESLLDQLSLLEGEVSVDKVWDLVGSVPERDLMDLLEAIAQDNPETLLDSVRRLMDRGREPLIVLQNLASFYRDLLIAKTAPTRNDLVALTPPTWAALCSFAQALDVQTILAGQQQLRSSEDQIKSTTQPRLWLEVTLMGLLPSAVSSQRSAVSGQQSAVSSQRSAVSSQQSAASGQTASPSQAANGGAAVRPPIPAAMSSHTEAIVPNVAETEVPAIEKPLPVSRPAEVSAALPVATSQPASDQGSNLSETWQQILSHIDLKGTRAMLSVNCHLLSQNDDEILVGVKAQSMIKMITGMIPQLEKASAKAFKTKVKVALQVVEAPPQAAQTTPPPETVDRLPSSDTDRPAPANASMYGQATSGQATGFSQPNQAGIDSPPKPTNRVAEGSVSDSPPLSTSERWQQEDEVTLAAKQLADFFGGRVVDMSDSDTVAEAPKLAEIDAASLKAKATEEPEEDLDSDDDVPF